MDTTTRKSEALYILKVIERGSADREFLMEARRGFYALMKAQGHDGQDYLDSVDACLTLPVPDGLRWVLWSNPAKNIHIAWLVEKLRDVFGDNPDEYRSLPIAMLYAYWTVDDGDED